MSYSPHPDRPDCPPVPGGASLIPESAPTSVPQPLTPLIGREREVALVTSRLTRDDLRLLVLTGPGGVGKTRIALQVVADLEQAYQDGVIFVPLAPIHDSSLVLPTIAEAFGLRDTGSSPVLERLVGFLQHKHLLLVLDNMEQVFAVAPQIAALLAACPGVTALVTSRTVLHVTGEHDVRVAPLALPDPAGASSMMDIGRADAIHLFVTRAAAARDDFTLNETNATDVVAICRRVEGLPLAIELAAARIAHLTPAALRARLDRQLALLTGGPRDQPARLRSMREAISWSFDLLTPDEQVIFQRMAVCVGGCTLDVTQALCVDHDGVHLLEYLSALVDASLLRLEAGPGGEPRYVMLETLREYGLERLAQAGDRDAVRRAHAHAFLALAEAADEGLMQSEPMPRQWQDRLNAERDNLRAALNWLLEQHDAERGLRLAGALGHFWFMGSYFREGADWLERALALAPFSASEARALAARWAGVLLLYQAEIPRADAYLAESLRGYHILGDAYGIALALVGIGLIGIYQGDYPRAIARHEEALALVRALGDEHPRPAFLATVCLHNLGMAVYGDGDLDGAARSFEEALARVRDLGQASLALITLAGLGHVVRDQGDATRAEALFKEVLQQAWARHNPRIIAYALAGLASIAGTHGQLIPAARLFGAVDALTEMLGIPLMPAFQPGYERAVQTVGSALPAPAFTAAWTAGRALPLAEAVAESLAMVTTPESTSKTMASSSLPGLTRREWDVLRLLVDGRSDREIGDALGISGRTVGAHITHLLTKLGVTSRTAAASHAVRHDLV